jgi:hypothetical protein
MTLFLLVFDQMLATVPEIMDSSDIFIYFIWNLFHNNVSISYFIALNDWMIKMEMNYKLWQRKFPPPNSMYSCYFSIYLDGTWNTSTITDENNGLTGTSWIQDRGTKTACKDVKPSTNKLWQSNSMISISKFSVCNRFLFKGFACSEMCLRFTGSNKTTVRSAIFSVHSLLH